MTKAPKFTVKYSFEIGTQTINERTWIPLTRQQAEKKAKELRADGMKTEIVAY